MHTFNQVKAGSPTEFNNLGMYTSNDFHHVGDHSEELKNIYSGGKHTQLKTSGFTVPLTLRADTYSNQIPKLTGELCSYAALDQPQHSITCHAKSTNQQHNMKKLASHILALSLT